MMSRVDSPGHKRPNAQRISTSYVDQVPLVNDTGASMISGCRFEARAARPLAVDVSSLGRLTLALGLLLSILLLNLRGLLLLDNRTCWMM
jgi:hypothetical protein